MFPPIHRFLDPVNNCKSHDPAAAFGRDTFQSGNYAKDSFGHGQSCVRDSWPKDSWGKCGFGRGNWGRDSWGKGKF